MKSILCLATALGLAPEASARDLPARRQTTLDVEFYDQEVAPSEPSHVTVPANEAVIVRGDLFSGSKPVIALQWLKDGQPVLDEHGSQLTIGFVTAADAGVYTARLTLQDGQVITSQALVLGVAPAERLVNLSTLTALAAGPDKVAIAGFVVSGRAPKKIIVRAVGPSLTQFGLDAVLKRPVLRIHGPNGQLYENGYVYPSLVNGPTYEQDLAASLVKVGAFPTLPGAADAVRLLPVAPGSYTVNVASAEATPGAVLIEIYEVP